MLKVAADEFAGVGERLPAGRQMRVPRYASASSARQAL